MCYHFKTGKLSVLNILIVLHASWTHDVRRSCQSSLSYFFFRHWHSKCTLISASAQPLWSWLRVLLLRSSNFIVVKSSSTGVGGSDYCKWACSLYSNSGIDRIDFVHNCVAFTVLVCPWSQIPGLIHVLGWWVSHPPFQISFSSMFKLWGVRLFKTDVYFTPVWNIIDIHEQMQEWLVSTE